MNCGVKEEWPDGISKPRPFWKKQRCFKDWSFGNL
jgi:hypothetical protein